MALDNRRTVVLMLLDLSAAFDTVDHSVLLYRLENRFNIRDKAFSCFKSYLSNRSQSVIVNRAYSSSRDSREFKI